MTPEQKKCVSVKAYVGGYKVTQGRVLPEDRHDQKAAPKALRSGDR